MLNWLFRRPARRRWAVYRWQSKAKGWKMIYLCETKKAAETAINGVSNPQKYKIVYNRFGEFKE